MILVITALVALLTIAILIDKSVENYPQQCYFIYRYSGSIFLVFFALGVPLSIVDRGFLPVLPCIGLLFYPIWLAKVAGLCLYSSNNNVFMILLKIFFGIACLVIFPIGFLASYMHNKFATEIVYPDK